MRQAKLKPALLFTEAAPGKDWADYPMFQYLAGLNDNFRRHCVKMAMALNAGSNKALTHFGDAIHAPDPLQQALQGSNGVVDQPESTRVEEMNMSVEPDCVRMDKRVATSTTDSQGREYNVAQMQQTMVITNEMWSSMMAKQDAMVVRHDAMVARQEAMVTWQHAAENRMKYLEEQAEKLRQTNVDMITEYMDSVKQHHALEKNYLTTTKMHDTKLGELIRAHNILFHSYESFKDSTSNDSKKLTELVKANNSLAAGCEKLKANAVNDNKRLTELVKANNSLVKECRKLQANAVTDRARAAENLKNTTEDRHYVNTIAKCINGLINFNTPLQMQVPILYRSPPRQQVIGAQHNAQAPGAPLKPSAPRLAPVAVHGSSTTLSPLSLGGNGAMMQPPPPPVYGSTLTLSPLSLGGNGAMMQPPPPPDAPSSSVVDASSNSNAVGGVGAAAVDAGVCGTRQEAQTLQRVMEISREEAATEKVIEKNQQRVIERVPSSPGLGEEQRVIERPMRPSEETELQEIDRSLVWAPGYMSTVEDIKDLIDHSKFRGGRLGMSTQRLAEIVQRKSGKRGFSMMDVIDYDQNPPKRLRMRGVENFQVVTGEDRRPWINDLNSTCASRVTEMGEFFRIVKKKDGAVVALAEIQERLNPSKFVGGRKNVSLKKVQHLFKAVFGILIKDLEKVHVPTDDNPPVYKTVDGFRNFELRI